MREGRQAQQHDVSLLHPVYTQCCSGDKTATQHFAPASSAGGASINKQQLLTLP
jgi:hypothetical protein